MMKSSIIFLFTIILFVVSCSNEKVACIKKELINPQAMCTQEYKPVCGCNEVTYGNACEAKNAGVTTWEEGECEQL